MQDSYEVLRIGGSVFVALKNIFKSVIILFLCQFGLFVTSNSTYADTYTASISSSGLVEIGLMGGSSSDTAASTITANTTCPNGYTISINGANDNETSDFNLYLGGDDEDDNSFATSSGTLTNPIALSANSWGILVNNNLYSGLTTSPVAWFNAATGGYTPGTDSTYTVTYGASHSGSLSAGTYTMADNGRVVYTLEMDNTCTSYTVAFDANEPTGADPATGTMANQTITEGIATPLTTNAYEITGYTFTGWNTAADGSGTNYANEASVTNLTAANTTITLYAQWALNIIQNYAGCPYLDTGDEVLLTDIRDGKTYWVAKFADGHCWMTQNLDLDLETTPSQVTALTSENTDLNVYNISGYTSALGYSQDATTDVITWTPERATITPAELDASNWATSNNYTHPYSLNPGAYYYTDTYEPTLASPGLNYLTTTNETYIKTTPYVGNGVHGHVGNYYTWSAAVASNDTSGYSSSTYANVRNNPQNSICPAGWRLPLTTSAAPTYTSQGSLDEVKRLNYVVNNNVNVTNSSAKLEASPLYMTRAGFVEVGAITRGGRGSGIWTSTIQSSTQSYTLYFSGVEVYAPSGSVRGLGYPVRCVSRDEAVINRTISFQANEPAGAGTATGSMLNQIIPDGLTTALDVNNFKLSGYVFTGWNTAADGTGTAYTNGGSITPSSDITLYAQWTRSYALTYNFGTESFDGASYLNTNIQLFNTALISNDFTLSFSMSDSTYVSGQNNNWNNIATAMKEVNPYPGFVVRRSNAETNTQYRFAANAVSANEYNPTTKFNNSEGVNIERRNGFLYLNNGTTSVLDFNQLANTFDSPLIFGAGLNSSDSPWRYANIELSDIILTINFTNSDTVTLPAPVKTNDTFLSWNTTADGSGTSYSAGDSITITENTTLYPIWQSDIPAATHTVTFLANEPTGAPSATGTMSNQTITENVATNLTANAYAISGYTFTGWNTVADGSGTSYANEASVTISSDLTLYARWIDNSLLVDHTLTFAFGNESFDGTNYLDTNIKLFGSTLNSKDFDLSFGMGSNTAVPNQNGNLNNIACAMSEAGQPYPGFVVRYSTSPFNATQYSFVANSSTASADKVSLNGIANASGFKLERISGEMFLNNSTTATVDFNHLASTFESPLLFGAGLDGSNALFRYSHIDLTDINLTLTFANSDTYTLPTPTKSLYNFVEWNTASDGSGTSYNAGDSITMSSDLTLYPIWQSTLTPRYVTFHANEPTGTATGSMPNQTFYDGIEDNLNANTFALTDYIFLGWNTAADGSGTDYADGAAVTLTSDLDLYAKWFAEADIETYTISYEFGTETFDGTNYLNTGIMLFDDDNIDRSFNIGFSLDSFTYLSGQNSDRNAFITAMDESASPYPGFVLRYANANAANNKYSFATYSTSSNKPKVESAMPSLPTSVSLVRNGRVLTFNNSTVIDYSDIAFTFSRPLMFGASINEAGTGYYRYSDSSLSDISVALDYTNLETITLPAPEKPSYTFLEWNTVADGSGTSYVAGDTLTLSSNLTLYPIWDHNVPFINEYHEINLTSSRSASSETIDLTDMDMGNSVEFRSSNTSVATVNASGVVTAVAPGEATITVSGDKKTYYNVYVSEPNVSLFNITPEPVQVYYNSRDAWDVTKTKADFLANLEETFENYNCKVYDYTDNSGRLDSAIAYGWTDGTEYCDQSRAYDTGESGALNVYLYDTVNSQTTGSALDYTGAVAGKIYNMIPGETYYWESVDDPTANGYVKATGKHRILNFTQGDTSRVSGSQITRNTREIGGLPVDTNYDGTIDGYTKYGKIFRGERLWTSNGLNVDRLTNLGANFEIDVRNSGEGSTDRRLANYLNDTATQYQVKQGVDTSNYSKLRAVVTRAMQDVIDGYNIYFHCSYGSDRTGTLAWVLEGLLGVTDEDRLGDYELSTFYGAVDRNRYFEYEGSNTKRFTYMMTFMETGQDVYDWYMYGTSDRSADETLINNFRAAAINYNS